MRMRNVETLFVFEEIEKVDPLFNCIEMWRRERVGRKDVSLSPIFSMHSGIRILNPFFLLSLSLSHTHSSHACS